jgi:phosphoheptose isomerase
MRAIDLNDVSTYPIALRPNLVRLADLVALDTPPPDFDSPELTAVIDSVVKAKQSGKRVIWMMGAHVIKSGLSRMVIDLMRRGIVDHVAGNGAVSIHDLELALIGETSEDVATSLEDGSFGMAHETGALLHQAIQEGARDGLGYGAAVGRFIAEHPDRFPHRDVNVLYNAYTLGVPATIHVTIGADIIHQHPKADFAAVGAASGLDFRIFSASVSELEGGVFLNFGSAVTGPEVFLKALTVARNLGHTVAHITTANFDMIPIGDLTRPVGYDDPIYYYRPRKNIVIRPTSLSGHGYHVTGNHLETIPNLYHRVIAAIQSAPRTPGAVTADRLPGEVAVILNELVERRPNLTDAADDLVRVFRELARCFEAGGTLFICGNGGSMADALHISGELLKSYAHRRRLPARVRDRLTAQPDGEVLTRNLEPGLRTVVLGANAALASAVANDMPDRDMGLAQELLALARPGDALLGISTSGNARNVGNATRVARALGLATIALTGQGGGRLKDLADIIVRAPQSPTDRVQEAHVCLYHTLCEMLEVAFFGSE